MKKLRCLIAVLCLLSLSCTKDVEKFFTLSENRVDFASEGGEWGIEVTANTNWEVMFNNDLFDWMEVKVTTEDGNGTIQIYVKPNKDATQRNATVTVIGQGKNIRMGKGISITQEAATYLHGVATVLGRNPDCGTFMIQFDEEVPGLPSYSYALGNVFHGINLPEEYKVEGERIEVTFRLTFPDEALQCTAMGTAYPSIFIVNVYPYFPVNLEDILTLNQQKVTIDEGIWGTLLQREGDCQPVIEIDYFAKRYRCRTFPIQREILVYEYTLWKDAVTSSFSPVFFETVFSKLVAITTCDRDGFFELALEPGKYSLFIREKELLYANWGDGQGGVCPIAVEPDKVSEMNLILDYASY